MKLAPKGWNSVIERALEVCLELKKEGIEPTLRSIFYRLSSEGFLIHTQNAYKVLSKKITEARLKGFFPWGLLVDTSRDQFLGKDHLLLLPIDGIATIALERAKEWIRSEVKPPLWYGQPYHVEIWVEKDAVVGYFTFVNKEWQLTIFPSRGFSSSTWMYKKSREFLGLIRSGKKIVVLVAVDFDPSGYSEGGIFQTYKRYMDHFGIPVKFVHLMIKPEQIRKYDLPQVPPGSPSYRRIVNDPRYKSWLRLCLEEGIEPKPVELDAFCGLYPKEFKETVLREIKKWFDESLYKQVVKKLEEKRKKEAEGWVKKIEELLR